LSKLISIILPNLCGGGAERVALYLANHWVDQKFEVEFVLMDSRGELLELVDPRIPIHSLRASRIRDSILPLRAYFADRKPAVAWVGLWSLTSAAIFTWQIAGRPGTLFTIDHTNLIVSCLEELKLSPLYVKALLRTTYPLATGLMAVSEGVKQALCQLGGFADESVEVIYNPVVRGLVDRTPVASAMRDELWGSGFNFHVLSVGSFKTQKNFPLLLRAFSRLPRSFNAKLTILGEGLLRPELEGMIQELGMEDRIALPGFALEPSPWFRSADLFVMSSSWEGLPTVMIEALECGVPVVSTDCPSGPAEILENGRYGRLVPVGDALALAAGIQASLLDSHDHEALRRRAQDFAVPRIADQYLAYFRSKGAQI
jgi:glycosyltransferase involved in cell wall biosynthesis